MGETLMIQLLCFGLYPKAERRLIDRCNLFDTLH